MFDMDQFENTAAWLEHCDGMSKFSAETEAARRQGMKRFEVMNENSKRDIGGCRNIGSIPERKPADNLSRVQPVSEKENGPVPKRDVSAGRDSLALLALLEQRRGVL